MTVNDPYPPDDTADTAGGEAHWSEDDGWHRFQPGINRDDPEQSDPSWCNVCGLDRD